MSFYYPQPSNKSWADMSKSERKATGQTKKEYNRSTGQGIVSKPPPKQVIIDRPMPMPTPITGPGPDRPIYKPPGSIYAPIDRGPYPGFGGSIGQPPDMARTADFRDSDGDGVDDRDQRRPGGKNINERRRKAQSLKDNYTKNIVKKRRERRRNRQRR